MSCQEVADFVQKKREFISIQNAVLEILSSSSPLDFVSKQVQKTVAAKSSSFLSDTPLAKLGQDFLAEQIAKQGQQLIDNATGALEREINKVAKFNVRKTIEEAQTQVYNTIAVAMTANNDLSIIFLQDVARNAVRAIEDKKKILEELKTKVRELHNALAVLVSGQPFFNQYLVDLRKALQKISIAIGTISTVRNNYVKTKKFSPRQFNTAKTTLEEAAALMTPAKQQTTSISTNELLQNLGVPTKSEQLTALMSVPQKAQEVVFAASGYFIATLKVNALLLAFQTGYENFTKASSKTLDKYSIDMMDSIVKKLDDLAQRMAKELNGDPANTQTNVIASAPFSGIVTDVSIDHVTMATGGVERTVPLPDRSSPQVRISDKVQIGKPLAIYNPDSVKVAAQSLGWVIELRTIIDHMTFVPGSTLSAIQQSNSAVDAYNRAVEKLQTKDNRTQGSATLTATDGREELGQLEAQIQTLVLKSVRAIADANVAAGVTALSRTIMTRLDLSLTQDAEITQLLNEFINTRVSLHDTLSKSAAGIKKALRNFGLDRAADLLESGSFADFFNLNSKTATYAGAALVGIAKLKECLGTVEDREALTNAEREIQGELKAKDLLSQRAASSGFLQQIATNDQNDQKLATIENQARNACNKCGLPEDFNPLRLLGSLTSVLGFSALGGSTLPKSLANIGKGFL